MDGLVFGTLVGTLKRCRLNPKAPPTKINLNYGDGLRFWYTGWYTGWYTTTILKAQNIINTGLKSLDTPSLWDATPPHFSQINVQLCRR